MQVLELYQPQRQPACNTGMQQQQDSGMHNLAAEGCMVAGDSSYQSANCYHDACPAAD